MWRESFIVLLSSRVLKQLLQLEPPSLLQHLYLFHNPISTVALKRVLLVKKLSFLFMGTVFPMLEAVMGFVPLDKLAVHFHDTWPSSVKHTRIPPAVNGSEAFTLYIALLPFSELVSVGRGNFHLIGRMDSSVGGKALNKVRKDDSTFKCSDLDSKKKDRSTLILIGSVLLQQFIKGL